MASLAVQSGIFAEVVVVDDGSSDGTADAARAAGARVIRHAVNRGKAQAMLTGLKETTTPLVCFLDADLLGVTDNHLAALVSPVIENRAQAVLGVFAGGRTATTLAQRIAPMISGQRCLRRGLLDDFTGWDSRFGIEIAVNDHIRRKGIKQLIVRWEGASQVMKEEKRGVINGFLARMRMYLDIISTWFRMKRKDR